MFLENPAPRRRLPDHIIPDYVVYHNDSVVFRIYTETRRTSPRTRVYIEDMRPNRRQEMMTLDEAKAQKKQYAKTIKDMEAAIRLTEEKEKLLRGARMIVKEEKELVVDALRRLGLDDFEDDDGDDEAGLKRRK